MKNKSKISISVIVPVYKVQLQSLAVCLSSLHRQTLDNGEFLIILDGHDEQAESACQQIVKDDERFKIIINEHKGVSATRNYGINAALGEYMTFVDADDRIDDNCLKNAYEFAIQNDSEILLFDCETTNTHIKAFPYEENDKRQLSKNEIIELKKQTILTTSPKFIAAVSTWCKLEKRDFITRHNILFNTKESMNVDRAFNFSIYSHATKISYLCKAFYHYNSTTNSITNAIQPNVISTALQYLRNLKEQTSEYNDLIGTQAYAIFFGCFGKYFFCDENKDTLKKKIANICETAKSGWFKDLTAEADIGKLIPILRVEAFFIRHGIMLPVWAHAIKWKICSTLKAKREP